MTNPTTTLIHPDVDNTLDAECALGSAADAVGADLYDPKGFDWNLSPCGAINVEGGPDTDDLVTHLIHAGWDFI